MAITLYGSTARNQDTKYSDIELNVFTKKPIKLKTKEYLFNEIAIGIYVHPIKEVEKKIEKIGWLWPLEMAQFLNNKLLYGDKGFLSKLENKINSQPIEKRIKAVEECIPSLIEVVNKVKAAKDIYNLTEYSREILYYANLFVALINKKVFTRNYYKNWLLVFKYPKLPKGYKNIVNKIFLCRDAKSLKSLLDELLYNLFDFLKKNGIKKKIYNDLSFI